MRTLLLLLLPCALALCGCASRRVTAAPQFEPLTDVSGGRNVILTPEHAVVGKVYSVNPDGQFVVLTYALGRFPALNQRLGVYRRGLKVAEVKVAGPQRDDYIVADIVAGDPQAGDEARAR